MSYFFELIKKRACTKIVHIKLHNGRWSGGIGRHPGFKILCSLMSVRVQVPPPASFLNYNFKNDLRYS